jgi:hypothetical protein
VRRLRNLNERAAGGKLSDDPHALGMHDGDAAYRENAAEVDRELKRRNGELSLPTMSGKRAYPVMRDYRRPYQDTSEFAALSMPDAALYNTGFESGFLKAMKGASVGEATEEQTPQEREVSEALSNAESMFEELVELGDYLKDAAASAQRAAADASADADGVASVQKLMRAVETRAEDVARVFAEARGYLKDAVRLARDSEAPEESA